MPRAMEGKRAGNQSSENPYTEPPWIAENGAQARVCHARNRVR